MPIEWSDPWVRRLIADGRIAAPDVQDVPKKARSPLPSVQTPQEVLFGHCRRIWGEEEVKANWRGLLPEHKHEIDIYFPSQRWGIEVQSEEFHGNKTYGPRKMYEDAEKSRRYGLIGVSIYYVMSKQLMHQRGLLEIVEWVKQMREMRG